MSYNYYDPKDMTKENLVQDKEFLEDARVMLAEREGFQSENPEELYDRFMEHFRYQNVNEVSATRDLFYVQGADDVTKERFGRLMDTFDKMDSDLGYDAVQDYLGGVFTAPSTYAGMFSFGAGKAGALAAQQGIKLGIREILKKGATESLKKQGIRATAGNIAKETAKASVGTKVKAGLRSAGQGFIGGGYKTAGASMLIDGAVGGYTVYQQERIRDDLGLVDGVSLKNVALATTFSALGSGAIGAITGTKRTLSSNMAEQIRQIAISKESKGIESAHANFTQKVFKGTKTKKDAKDFLKTITDATTTVKEKGKKKLALSETVPEKLAEGKQLKESLAGDIDFKSGNYVPTIEDKFHENIAAAASRIVNLKKMPAPITRTVKNEKGKTEIISERISSRLSRGLTSGAITDNKIFEILGEHNITMTQLSSLMVEEYSQFGKGLSRLGRIAKLEKKGMLEELTELDQKLINLADIVTPAQKVVREQNAGIGTKIAGVYKNWFSLGALNKARIGMMTIQTATTARNTTNGYMRNYVYALDNLGEGFANTLAGGTKALAGSLGKKELRDEGIRAVKMGVAQMRTGGQAAYGKDLWLGTKSWETEALELLFRDKRFAKSDMAKTIFKEMGDVAEITGAESGVVWIARKANFLNTLSDNMFKRAVFSREIDKYLFASGQKGGLKGFFEEAYLNPQNASKSIGKFSLLDDKAIGDAMAKALDFTYQGEKFAGRAGLFNKGADLFIKLASTPLGSLAIPFPRYIINQLIFQYEHMPLIGSINLGGILNKGGGQKGIKGNIITDNIGLKLDAEAFGKQTSGLAMLGTFFAIRNHFGDENTGPYEFKAGGRTYDLTASLGPFMGYAYLADWLYRHSGPNNKKSILGVDIPQLHDNDKVAVGIDGKARDAINAFTGGTAKAGTGLWVVDTLVDNLINYNQKGGANDQTLNEITAKLVGDMFNSATVGVGMLKDIAGTVLDPDYRVLKDSNSVDMMEYMFKRAIRSFPQKYDENEDTPVYNPSRDVPLYNVNPFLKMVTGITEKATNTRVQDEFARLKFDYREIAPRKMKSEGIYSNLAKGEMGRAVDRYILPYISSDDYLDLPTDNIKRMYLKEMVNNYRRVSRTKVMKPDGGDTQNQRHRKFKARYFDIPASKRKIIETAYKDNPKFGNGQTLYDVTTPLGEGDYLGGLNLYLQTFGKITDDLFPTSIKAFDTLN